ncbi:MAG: CYTH domain-containing protein [Bacteroidota bacterium]
MIDYKDYTIKAKIRNIEPLEKILISMNASFVGLDNQTDYYFETDKGKLKYRHGTLENLITHYERTFEDGIEKTTVYQYDKNPTLDQIEKLRAEKKQIGVTTKERKIYTLKNVKIHLDKLPDGQCYIEIEAIDLTNSFTDNELKRQCLMIKSKLLISDNSLVTTGYLKGQG